MVHFMLAHYSYTYVLTWRRSVYLQRTGHVRPKRRYGVVSVRKPTIGLRRRL